MTGCVDADAHIFVNTAELAPFLDQPWRYHAEAQLRGRQVGGPTPMEVARTSFPTDIGDLSVGGRIKRPLPPGGPATPDPVGAVYRVVYPQHLLGLGLHPTVPLESAYAAAYARWLTEVHLPAEPASRGMLYLPMREPEEALHLVEEFSGRPGVVGAFMTTAGHLQIQANRYMDLYAALEERGLVLAVHPTSLWLERPADVFTRYLDVWAVGQTFSLSLYLTNWIVHGLPERFPRLRCVFLESGLSWIFFIGHRLDRKYMERPSEAPLLRRLPTEYMRDCYFTSHPRESVADLADLEAPLRLVGPERILFASNFPRWDFDTPGVIDELPFLDDRERAWILRENARALFGLDGRGG